jgi:putative membrane-bound dehydrogenase-like protein
MKPLYNFTAGLQRHFTLIKLVIAAALFSLLFCNGKKSTANPDAVDPQKKSIGNADAPVVPAEEAIRLMQVENGFRVQLVASEPMVNAPVVIQFDEKGRMWVIEMEGYMPDINGKGEELPLGKIVILEDVNKDGKMDSRKVFMDSLVLPRAICLIEQGLLVAEPPNLWYVKIVNDKAAGKTLVDPEYTDGGNVEHQPNALFRAMDNWIYNAEGRKKYRKKGNTWLIEPMQQRGQWGLTMDDHGRLFYNNNSQNFQGDYFPPRFGTANSNQRRPEGFNRNIVPDNRVFPARPTTGVNRGYLKGVLDDSMRLVNFTAASGPVLYRGHLFDKAYYNNAFVPEPSANLIKRNILQEKGYEIIGRQAYKGKEFLASTDERFRPVTASNGPDGALYVVDMYRGVIQHKTYLTDYLKNEIKSRNLEKPLNCGRIYKVIPVDSKPAPVVLSTKPAELPAYLAHPNAWVREKAQQLLVDMKSAETVAPLRNILQKQESQQAVAHALWSLEGMGKLEANDVLPLLQHSAWNIRLQALTVSPSVITTANYRQFLGSMQKMLQANDTLAAPYLGFLVNTINSLDKKAATDFAYALIHQYPRNPYIADAIITGLQDREATFLKELVKAEPDTMIAINRRLTRLVADMRNSGNNAKARTLERNYPKGSSLYKSICQTCHGADGNGIKFLAPPLNNSNWVKGNKNRLIPIILFGLTGPVKVNETLYAPPEINGDMPGLGNNKEISDEDLAELMSFIRKAWNNESDKVSAEEVKKIRAKYKGRQKPFTAAELNRIK